MIIAPFGAASAKITVPGLPKAAVVKLQASIQMIGDCGSDEMHALMCAGPVALMSVVDWSPDNRTGSADYVDGWLQTAKAADAMVVDQQVCAP